MNASDYQRAIEPALKRYFADVQLEWSVVKGATDALSADLNRYAPRVDIAVGPFNKTPGPDPIICETLLPPQLRELFADRTPNPNPRCLLAIEVHRDRENPAPEPSHSGLSPPPGRRGWPRGRRGASRRAETRSCAIGQ